MQNPSDDPDDINSDETKDALRSIALDEEQLINGSSTFVGGSQITTQYELNALDLTIQDSFQISS